MVIACLALTIALTGASYAAVVLPRNSVGTVQLKRGAVHTSDIYGSAVTSGKVRNFSLQKVDLAAGVIPAATAATVVNSIVRVEGPIVTVVPSDAQASIAGCPAGMGIISGGYIAGFGEVFASESFGGPVWAALFFNFGSTSTTIQAFAYCAPSGQAVAPRSTSSVQSKINAAIAAQLATH